MSLTTVEKNVFIFLNHAYFYMYSFPLKWNSEYTRLTISKRYFIRLIPFIFVITYSFVYALICLFTAVYFYSKSNLRMVELLIFFLTFYALSYVVLVVLILSLNIHLCLDFCNETMQMANRIQNGVFLILLNRF